MNGAWSIVCEEAYSMKAAYIGVFLVSVLIASVSQILLKQSADGQYESKVKEYLNIRVAAAYILLFASSLLTILAYRGVPLSMGPVLETTGYLWVTILGALILKERVNRRKVLGLTVIVCGVILSGIS